MNPAVSHLKQLPLDKYHRELGAKIGTFGVWEVPLYYSSILEEHQAVRNQAGLFDISHMGEFLVEGADAEAFLERMVPRALGSLKEGRAAYTPLLNDAAGMIDDIIIYKCSPRKFIIIVNADNVDKDYQWFKSKVSGSVTLTNQTDLYGLLALQGPASSSILSRVLDATLPAKGYHFTEWKWGMIARTGYTGEDGFEIMTELSQLSDLWSKLMVAGKEFGLKPCGFGARDTLRLEAGMLLYGHDMDDNRNPVEAGIEWTVDYSKNFIGSSALMNSKKKGITTKLIGFKMLDRGIPRQGYTVQARGGVCGTVTSGSFSPTLQANIGMAYVQVQDAEIGRQIEIIIRDKPVRAEIVQLPFYKRKR